MGEKLTRIKALLNSKDGKNTITFLVFIVISAVLWIVQELNVDTERDLRCSIQITNVPDSLVRVTAMPEVFNVGVRARGTQLMKYWWRHSSQIKIDYRSYKTGNKIFFNETSLKALFRNYIGANSQILSVYPDSLLVAYTSNKGVKLPVKIDAHITTAPQYAIVGKVQAINDTVTLYSLDAIPSTLRQLTTKAITLTDLKKSQTLKVPIVVPKNSRAIPDSLSINIEVEPLISKTRKVPITTINVPANKSLIPVPSQVEVYYMVPMNVYKKSEGAPKFRVEADYASINLEKDSKVAISLANAPKNFTNVYLSTDSVDFLIEEK